MRLSRLRLKNFGPFRGEHLLELGPTLYAVTARRVNDPDSSNWSGKTSLLEAIRFALFGEHRHRHEDSWITDGEADGLVGLEFDSGPSIERKRVRGKSTKLWAVDGEHEAVGDAAREWIERWLGLGPEDFDACHLAQGQASAFVTGDPATRTERVASWFELDKVEACAEGAKGAAKKLESDVSFAFGQRDAALRRTREALQGMTEEALRWELTESMTQLEEVRRELEVDLASQEERGKDAAKVLARREYARVVEEGKALRVKLEEVDRVELEGKKERLEKDKRFLIEQLGSLRMDREKKRVLARGEFSGTCPVAGIECPVAETIRGMTKEHDEEFKQHDHAVRVFEQDLGLVDNAIRTIDNSLFVHRQETKRLEELREQARRLKEQAGPASGNVHDEDLGPRIAQLRGLERHLVESIQKLSQRLEAAMTARAEAGACEARIAELEAELKIARAAATIFGRRGAQKRIASGHLRDIEGRANSLLRKVGVDLNVSLEWEREGKGLAQECGGCGWGYPSSRQVASCGACGLARGPNMIRSLQARPSRVSGAANDLAGLALAMGAYGWLRERREARWAVAMLDEVFAQTDRAHRRGVSARVCGMLKEVGMEQGFVVSHDASTAAAMPGKIEIVSDGKHARIEVVS